MGFKPPTSGDIARKSSLSTAKALSGTAYEYVSSRDTNMDIGAIYSFLATLNPIILIVVGVVLIFASKLAKFVGAVCTILGVILLLLPFLLTMI